MNYPDNEKEMIPNVPTPRLVYTPRDLEPLLQLSKNTINKLLQRGDLRGVRVGRKWLIPHDAITEFLARRREL